MPTTMTLTGKGQFTFNKQLLEHLQVKAGDMIVIKKQADASLKIEAQKTQIDILSLAGSIIPDTHASDEDIQDAIRAAYADAGMQGLQ